MKITKDDIGKWVVIWEKKQGFGFITSIKNAKPKTITTLKGYVILHENVIFVGTEKQAAREYNKIIKKIDILLNQKKSVADKWFAEKLKELRGSYEQE